MEIDLSKVFWAFWQSSEAYRYDEHNICLFKYELRSSNGKDVFHHGFFRLFKTFTMSDGKMGVDVTKPLFSFFSTDPFENITEDGFKKRGLTACYEQYLIRIMKEA